MPNSSQVAAWISAIGALLASRRGASRVEALQHLRRQLRRQRPAGERAEGDDADQRALERADVAVDAFSDQLERLLVGQLDSSWCGALAQDREARGEVGRADVGDQPGLEALAQPVLERLQVVRRAVGGQHDLAARRRAGR